MTYLRAWMVVMLWAAVARADYSYSVVSPTQSFTMTAGETQSTVVGPGLKSQCPKGRFFVTNDLVRPPKEGTMVGRDLDHPATPDVKPTFDAVPDSANTYFGTNDHDVVTLNNGDILLVWGVHSKAPLNPKPAWFDYTYKGTFGPGTRRGMMVWRSVDCGQTFQYMTAQIDTAAVGDGSCAMPQPAGSTVPPGTATQPNYSNGGVDGQLVKVDLSSNTVYVMMQCVGYKQDTTKPGFILSSEHVNETFVMRSTDEGVSWENLGKIAATAWRFGVAPLDGKTLGFGRSNVVSFAGKLANGSYQMPTTEQAAPTASGWGGNFATHISPSKIVYANIYAHAVVSRVPGSHNLLFAFPSHITDGNGKVTFGYEVYFFDRAGNHFYQAPPILPLVHSEDNFTMHLAAIDAGSGPILLYWYDINAVTNKGTIRGRLIFGDQQSSQDISVANDAADTPHTFDLVPTSNYWFGDYKTGGGYGPHGITSTLARVYHYFPMWDEPDGTVHSSEVVVQRRLQVSFKKLDIVLIPKFKIGPPPVELRKHVVNEAERVDLRDVERNGDRF